MKVFTLKEIKEENKEIFPNIKGTIFRRYLVDEYNNKVSGQEVLDAYANLDAIGYKVMLKLPYSDKPDKYPTFGTVTNITDEYIYVDNIPVPKNKFHTIYEVD